MDPVVHFEMPYEDRQRLAGFYARAFGWQMNPLGEDYGGYVIAMTSESDQPGPKQPGAINGGFYDRRACPEQQAGASVVISVQNIGDAMQRVRDAGGQVLGEPMDIPDVGLYVSFIDSEGNRVSMLEPVRPTS